MCVTATCTGSKAGGTTTSPRSRVTALHGPRKRACYEGRRGPPGGKDNRGRGVERPRSKRAGGRAVLQGERMTQNDGGPVFPHTHTRGVGRGGVRPDKSRRFQYPSR